MNIKPGVVFGTTFSPQLLTVRKAVSDAWSAQGKVPTITSSYREGDAKAHGRGLAEDYRTHDLSPTLVFVLAADVSRRLGPLFEVIVEDSTKRWYYRDGVFRGSRSDKPATDPHMHVEYDAQGAT